MAVAPEVGAAARARRGRRRPATCGRPTGRRPRWPCWPRPRSATTSGPGIVDRARERFPDLWMPNRSDLCFATTNRQAALKALAGRCRRRRGHRLGELLQHGGPGPRWPRPFGCPRVVRVNDASELPDDLSGTVGVTAGASAPEALVEAVVARLAPADGVDERRRSPSRRSTSPRRPSCGTCCGASRRPSAC